LSRSMRTFKPEVSLDIVDRAAAPQGLPAFVWPLQRESRFSDVIFKLWVGFWIVGEATIIFLHEHRAPGALLRDFAFRAHEI